MNQVIISIAIRLHLTILNFGKYAEIKVTKLLKQYKDVNCYRLNVCYSEEQVISMLEFLIDNIFVSFGGALFQQVVGISMGTNCAPLLADLFLYSYEGVSSISCKR